MAVTRGLRKKIGRRPKGRAAGAPECAGGQSRGSGRGASPGALSPGSRSRQSETAHFDGKFRRCLSNGTLAPRPPGFGTEALSASFQANLIGQPSLSLGLEPPSRHDKPVERRKPPATMSDHPLSPAWNGPERLSHTSVPKA